MLVMTPQAREFHGELKGHSRAVIAEFQQRAGDACS
jgi:hypothetical protein